jgi:hypothetical protein
MEEFPGNSFAAKKIKVAKVEPTEEGIPTVEEKEREKLESVVNGTVKQRKKTLGARFRQHFATEGEGFLDHLVEKVVIPKSLELVNTIIRQTADAFAQGVEEALFGKSTTRPTAPPRPGYGNVHRPTPYHQMSSSARPVTASNFQPVIRRSNIVKDVVVEIRDDAELVLDTLRGIIERHGNCTLADFYDLVDITPTSTDNEWGWTDLRSARSKEISSGGYLIVLPRVESLEAGR